MANFSNINSILYIKKHSNKAELIKLRKSEIDFDLYPCFCSYPIANMSKNEIIFIPLFSLFIALIILFAIFKSLGL